MNTYQHLPTNALINVIRTETDRAKRYVAMFELRHRANQGDVQAIAWLNGLMYNDSNDRLGE